MPKIVDHEARRLEIVQALWRVIAREGMEGASVRTVAAEAGWSAGSVRHYFATQDELMLFAATAMAQGIEARIYACLSEHRPGPQRAVAVLQQFLPLDEQRLGECRAWLAMQLRASQTAQMATIQEQGWLGSRHVCRILVCDLADRPWPTQGESLDERAERLAARLHILVDGLSLQAATTPDLVPPAEVSRLVNGAVEDVIGELGRP